MAEKTRYTDEELAEFKEIIIQKLEKAKDDYDILKKTITHSESNDTQDTSPTFKVLEEELPLYLKRKPEDWLNVNRNLFSTYKLLLFVLKIKPTEFVVKLAN